MAINFLFHFWFVDRSVVERGEKEEEAEKTSKVQQIDRYLLNYARPRKDDLLLWCSFHFDIRCGATLLLLKL